MSIFLLVKHIDSLLCPLSHLLSNTFKYILHVILNTFQSTESSFIFLDLLCLTFRAPSLGVGDMARLSGQRLLAGAAQEQPHGVAPLSFDKRKEQQQEH